MADKEINVAYKRNMKGVFEAIGRQRAILRVIAGCAVVIAAIAGPVRAVEGAISGLNWISEGQSLTESQAEEVRAIWRVIGDQEIVAWNGQEWLAKTADQKRKAIETAHKAWETAGYQNIETAEYFIEDVDEYYNYHVMKNPGEITKSKVGLVLSLSAFFAGLR